MRTVVTRWLASGAIITLLTACAGASDPGAGAGIELTGTPVDATDALPQPTSAPTPHASPTPSEHTTATPGGTSAPSPTTSPSPTPTPHPSPSSDPEGELVISEEDSGRTFTFQSSSQAVLRLHPSFGSWSEPEVTGNSIQLAERLFFADPGYREWEIRIVGSGASMIRSASDPCPGADPPCGAPSRLFEITINVE